MAVFALRCFKQVPKGRIHTVLVKTSLIIHTVFVENAYSFGETALTTNDPTLNFILNMKITKE